MSSRDTERKKKSRPKVALEPISLDEILDSPGMSGFVSILDPREEVPHLQSLVDAIKDAPPAASPKPDIKRAPGVERDTGDRRDTGAKRDTGIKRDTGVPRVYRAVDAQDGHSAGEERLF